jgi:thiosulfate/3-mercaptopyruvate sulfurtransferase
LIVDLSRASTYQQTHIPGAVHLDYAQIVAADKPVMGLLPDDTTLQKVFSSIGLQPDHHVVAYDDEGGGKACRLLWTLAVIGHRQYSLLDGGLINWANEKRPLSYEPVTVTPGDYRITQHDDSVIADKQYILEHLDDPDIMLLDARSAEEYSGAKRYAARGGHIPGAVNLDWLAAIDRQHNARLLPAARCRALLEANGFTPDKEIITYCQTHHRSAFSFIMLKILGYPRVRGYPGSWSEWGNRQDTPVE